MSTIKPADSGRVRSEVMENFIDNSRDFQSTLETLITFKVNDAQIREKSKDMEERQQKMKKIHEIQQTINAACDDKGNIDLKAHPEVQEKLKEAEELGIKVNDHSKKSYSRDDILRTQESLNNYKSDLKTQQDLDLQKMNKLLNERNELIQFIHYNLRTLREITKKLTDHMGMRG